MLKAGAAEVCITPPIGVELAGYGPRLKRFSTAIHDHLMGQAIVLDDGQIRVAIITSDLIGLSQTFTGLVREYVHKQTGIPQSQVMVSCIHSHTAPTALDFCDWGLADRSYVRMVARHLAGAVSAANHNLKPAGLSAGREMHHALAWNRTMHGEVDPTVEVLRIDSSEGEPLALLVHYACHPVMLGPKSAISADYPGALRVHLKARYPGSVILFVNGPCGDIDPASNRAVWGQATFDDVDTAGAALAKDAWAAAENARRVQNTSITVRQSSLEMCYDSLSLQEIQENITHYRAEARIHGKTSERFEEVTGEVKMPRFWLRYYRKLEQQLLAGQLPTQEQAELQGFTIGGDVVIIGIPAEVYTEQGMAIRAQSEYSHTLPVCYANGLVGYIPPSDEFMRVSYAAKLAAAVYGRPPFQPTIAENLLAGVKPLLWSSNREQRIIHGMGK